MATDINPEMIILARESRGLTQSALAEAADVSQANISKYENGALNIAEDHLERIASALNYPTTFFYLAERRYGFGSSCTYHRKRQTLAVQDLRKLLGRVNVFRIRVARLFTGIEIETDNSFQHLDFDEFGGDVEHIAHVFRAAWRLPMGPIANLIGAVEAAGGVVHREDFGTNKLDALSQWVPDAPPVLFVNSEIPIDRLRFTLAHELGHLIMHRIPTENAEDEADRFAAEFLMPAREIGPQLTSLTWPDLARLKAYWKVSMSSLIRRAYQLEKITHRQYRSLYEQLSKQGYRVREPVTLPEEEPVFLRNIIKAYTYDAGYSAAQMSQLMLMPEAEYWKQYAIDRPGLRLVT